MYDVVVERGMVSTVGIYNESPELSAPYSANNFSKWAKENESARLNHKASLYV